MNTSGRTFSFYDYDIYNPMVNVSPKPNITKFSTLFSTALPEPEFLASKRSFTDRNKSLDLPSLKHGVSNTSGSSKVFNQYTKRTGDVFKKLEYIPLGPKGRRQLPAKEVYSKER